MKETEHENYAIAINSFSAGYNKGMVLGSVTGHSLEILNDAIIGIESGLSNIVSAFEEIRATSGSTADNAERIDRMMAEVLSGSKDINSGIEARMEDVKKGLDVANELGLMFANLKNKTQAVSNITGSIQDVSDRTNVLAINASIEAARAGQVGKGFRIIANEVRSLAGQTNNFAKQIEDSIAELSSSVVSIVSRMDALVEIFTRFNQAFGDVNSNAEANATSAQDASSLLAQIAGALKEETLALGHGLNSLEDISRNAKDTHAIFDALKTSHEFLDKLFDRKA